MQAVKPIEIVTDALEMREVCRVRDRLVVSGYSVIGDVTGPGERGVQSGDDLTDVVKNNMVVRVRRSGCRRSSRQFARS